MLRELSFFFFFSSSWCFQRISLTHVAGGLVNFIQPYSPLLSAQRHDFYRPEYFFFFFILATSFKTPLPLPRPPAPPPPPYFFGTLLSFSLLDPTAAFLIASNKQLSTRVGGLGGTGTDDTLRASLALPDWYRPCLPEGGGRRQREPCRGREQREALPTDAGLKVFSVSVCRLLGFGIFLNKSSISEEPQEARCCRATALLLLACVHAVTMKGSHDLLLFGFLCMTSL